MKTTSQLTPQRVVNHYGSKLKRLLSAFMLFSLFSAFSWGQTVPYTFANSSTYADNAVYVAVVGMVNGAHVWIDCKTGAVKPMSVSDNTVTGPIIGGNTGPGGNAKYANCFSQLSTIPNKIINIPLIAGCRILISFNSQLYLYFFGSTGAPSGYAAPNLANSTDPNQGIRFEMIELTYATNGLWTNTTRVDAYQYPMGLEVWGNSSFYKKVGELKTHAQIIAQWQSTAPAEFQVCLNTAQGIIKFPTKNTAFSTTYLDSYINSIWTKYASADLVFSSGDAGVWKGRVSGTAFVFNRVSDGQVATISRKPTTIEAMEGSGALASGAQWDLVVQAQVCAAINRHALDLNVASGVQQDWSNAAAYYVTSPFNWYCKFWHQSDISYNSLTYAFCYDDVFDKSSTINCPSPTRATITIGGFAGTGNVAVTGVTMSPTSASIAVNGTAQLTATVAPSNATNKTVTWTSNNTAIATVSTSGLVTGKAAGSATITVTTQDGSKTATCAVTVTASGGTNLALNKATTVSSTESASYPGSYAVDGNATTRWASAFSDQQWIYVDLGASYNVNRVKITWEAAYGKDYTVQVSANASTWTTIKTITGNTALVNDHTGLSGTGRYVRINGTARGTVYGYSIFSLEIYGTVASSGGCTIASSSGDYSASVSSATSNPTITFIPSRTGVGSPTCILYYGTSATGTLPGYTVTANTAYTITASSGQVIYFYYTYSVPEGGEKNTSTARNSFTVGTCSTLKSGEEATTISGTDANSFEAYPIPMNENLILKFTDNIYQSALITDITGKVVLRTTIEPFANSKTLNVSQLKKGAYYVSLQGTGTKASKLIIK